MGCFVPSLILAALFAAALYRSKSARMISLGRALLSSLITSATRAGLVFIPVSVGSIRAFVTLPNIFDYRAANLAYMVAHDRCCLLCISALARCKDGPVLSLGLVKVVHLQFNGEEM